MSEPLQVYPLAMSRESNAAVVLMPAFVDRVLKFLEVTGGHLNTRKIWHRLWCDFGTGDGNFLGIGLVGIDGKMRGHLLASIEVTVSTGDRFAMVLQWEKDEPFGQEIDIQCQSILDAWARAKGLDRISALAITPSRERIFKRSGYIAGPRLITREVIHG